MKREDVEGKKPDEDKPNKKRKMRQFIRTRSKIQRENYDVERIKKNAMNAIANAERLQVCYLSPRPEADGHRPQDPIFMPRDYRLAAIVSEKDSASLLTETTASQARTRSTVAGVVFEETPAEMDGPETCKCWRNLVRPDDATHTSHVQCKFIMILLGIAVVCAVGVAGFALRGNLGELGTLPVFIHVLSMTIGSLQFSDQSIFSDDNIYIDTNASIPGMAEFDSDKVSTRGDVWVESLRVGKVVMKETETGSVDIKSDTELWRIGGSLIINGEFSGTSVAEIAGLKFTSGGCEGCSYKISELLEEDGKLPPTVKFAVLDTSGKIITSNGKSVCVDFECTTNNKIPLSMKTFIDPTFHGGSVVTAAVVTRGHIQRIVQEGEQIRIYNDEIVTKEFTGSATAGSIAVDMNGDVWSVVALGDSIVMGRDSYVSVKNNHGNVLKIETVINAENELVVFCLTEEGLFVIDNDNLRCVSDARTFSVAAGGFGMITLAIVDKENKISIGRCRDDRCVDVNLRDTNARASTDLSFFRIGLSVTGHPVVIMSGSTTTVTKCTNPLCIDDFE